MLDNFISINKCQLWLRTKQYFSRAGIIIIKVNGKKEGGQRQVCFCCLGIQQFCHELSKKINISRVKGKNEEFPDSN